MNVIRMGEHPGAWGAAHEVIALCTCPEPDLEHCRMALYIADVRIADARIGQLEASQAQEDAVGESARPCEIQSEIASPRSRRRPAATPRGRPLIEFLPDEWDNAT